MTPAARSATSAIASQTALDSTQVVEAAAGTGKTTALVKRIVSVIRSGVDVDRDRRRDVHGEGGRRAEAEAARSDRTGAARRSGRRTIPRRWPPSSDALRPSRRGARQHDPHVLRGPAARAAGRGAHRSALRRPDRVPGGSHLRRGVPDVAARRSCCRREKACVDRCAAPRDGTSAATWTRTDRCSAYGTPAGRSCSGATTPAAWSRDPDWDRERAIDALLQAVEIVSALSPERALARRSGYKNLTAVRALASRLPGHASRACSTTTAGSRRSSTCRKNRELARSTREAAGLRARRLARADSRRAGAVDRVALTSFQQAADADLASQTARRPRGSRRGVRRRQAGARGARFPGSPGPGPRSRPRQCRRPRSELPGASRRCSSTSSRTPIRFRPSCSCCSRRTSRASTRRTLTGERAVVRPGALFIVGDPKQSIYRFRRADVGVYRDVCASLEAGGATRVQLQASFRATPTSSARSTPPSRP